MAFSFGSSGLFAFGPPSNPSFATDSTTGATRPKNITASLGPRTYSGKTNYEEEMECPICYETMKPPIKRCNNYHGYCKSCSVRSGKECSLCKLQISWDDDLRNEMSKAIVYSCEFSSLGCEKKYLLNEEAEHLKNCQHKGFYCKINSCGVLCKKEDLMEHVKSKHGNRFVWITESSPFYVRESVMIPEKKNPKFVWLLKLKDSFFWVTHEMVDCYMHSLEKKLLLLTHYDEKKFTCTVAFERDDGATLEFDASETATDTDKLPTKKIRIEGSEMKKFVCFSQKSWNVIYDIRES